tara:strand:+ start:839 stop:1609 length:771 start_codon:yes stop_codon:yes gene_type:complete
LEIKNISHPFRKKWGQNFLVDKNLLKKIVKTINLKNNDSIIEIGPGEGALTQYVYPKVKEMLVIEIDPLLIEVLRNRKDLVGLKIIKSDILLQDIEFLKIKNPVRIIGNIPYNITSSIIFWLIEQFHYWEDAFIMMQKEVARRLTAQVGTKSYGRLTVVSGAYLDFEYCYTIPPDVFIPKPKVDSALVRFTKKKHPLINDKKYIRFNKLVTSAFSQRRKMLRNTLKGWDIPKELQDTINFNRRPETLTIEEFIALV